MDLVGFIIRIYHDARSYISRCTVLYITIHGPIYHDARSYISRYTVLYITMHGLIYITMHGSIYHDARFYISRCTFLYITMHGPRNVKNPAFNVLQFFKDKTCLLYIKTQCLPRSKHTKYRL